jgi:HK97 gp10 family phage protein
MSITITVEQKVTAQQRRRDARAVIREYAERIQQRAEELVPHDTGALHASIRMELIDGGFVIHAGEGLDDERAKFQEYGFHHVSTGAFIQNPFLRPAFEQYKEALLVDLLAAVIGGEVT